MAEIVSLPTVAEPVTCGRLFFMGLPCHVWPEHALPGDTCVCGLSVLDPELAAKTLVPDSLHPV